MWGPVSPGCISLGTTGSGGAWRGAAGLPQTRRPSLRCPHGVLRTSSHQFLGAVKSAVTCVTILVTLLSHIQLL